MLSRREANNLKLTTPTTDVRDTDDSMQIICQMPGWNRDDINIDIDEQNHFITLSGKQSDQFQDDHSAQFEGDVEYHSREMKSGSFYQRFAIPENFKSSDLKTEMGENGTLKIILPK